MKDVNIGAIFDVNSWMFIKQRNTESKLPEIVFPCSLMNYKIILNRYSILPTKVIYVKLN